MKNEKVINPEIGTLAIYSEFEANLSLLEKQVKDAVVDLSTKQGIKDAKDAQQKLMKVRTGIEKKRKEETAEQREYIAKVNDQAKSITARVLPLENKFKEPLEERKQAFKDKLEEIDNMPAKYANASSEAIGVALGELEAIEPKDFAEFKKDCEASLYTANDKLSSLLTEAVNREEAERKAEEERKRREEEEQRQRELIAEQEKKAKIQARITKLQQIPLSLMGKTASEIKAKMDSLEGYTPTTEEFEDRLLEVEGMMKITVSQLEMMHNQAKQLEEMQARQGAAAQSEPVNEPAHSASVQALSDTEPTSYSTQLSEEDAPMYADSVADAPKTNVVESAMAEVCTETKQAQSASVLCELMTGELSLELATEIVGVIEAGLVPNVQFNA